MRNIPLIFLSIASLQISCISAQEAKTETPVECCIAKDVIVIELCVRKKPVEYAVRMSSIQTITLQNYNMRKEDKIRQVVEFTIETSGGNKNRFFWEGEPKPLIEFSPEIEDTKTEVKDSVEDIIGLKENFQACGVVKDYPLTTHGNWTEFKIKTEKDVRELHKSLMEAWTGKKR